MKTSITFSIDMEIAQKLHTLEDKSKIVNSILKDWLQSQQTKPELIIWGVENKMRQEEEIELVKERGKKITEYIEGMSEEEKEKVYKMVEEGAIGSFMDYVKAKVQG